MISKIDSSILQFQCLMQPLLSEKIFSLITKRLCILHILLRNALWEKLTETVYIGTLYIALEEVLNHNYAQRHEFLLWLVYPVCELNSNDETRHIFYLFYWYKAYDATDIVCYVVLPESTRFISHSSILLVLQYSTDIGIWWLVVW